MSGRRQDTDDIDDLAVLDADSASVGTPLKVELSDNEAAIICNWPLYICSCMAEYHADDIAKVTERGALGFARFYDSLGKWLDNNNKQRRDGML